MSNIIEKNAHTKNEKENIHLISVWRFKMKKCKIVVLAVIAVLAAAALTGCGNKENEETGSNPD